MKHYFVHVDYGGTRYYGTYHLSGWNLIVEIPYRGTVATNVGLLPDMDGSAGQTVAEILLLQLVKESLAYETDLEKMEDEFAKLTA